MFLCVYWEYLIWYFGVCWHYGILLLSRMSMEGLLWCRIISFSFKCFFIIYFCFLFDSMNGWLQHGIIVWNGNNNDSSCKTEMDVVITFDDCNEKCFKMVRQFLGYHWSFLVSFISGLLPHFILPFSIFNGWIGDDIHCSYVPIGNIWFGILVFVDIMVFFSCMGGLLWCRTISFSFKRFFIIYFCFQLASLWLIFFWSFGILSNNLDFIFC